jgi:hypothetical protein
VRPLATIEAILVITDAKQGLGDCDQQVGTEWRSPPSAIHLPRVGLVLPPNQSVIK